MVLTEDAWVLVRNQVKTEVKQGKKFTLSPQDKLELKANCDKLVDLFRANMGKDRDLNAVISAACGTISGRNLMIKYADVPAGGSTGYGTIGMDIISNDEMMTKDKPASYAGSHWVRER